MSIKKIISALTLAVVFQPVWADTLALNPDHPEVYIVQKGDTLWGISAQFLRDPWLWPKVWRGNPHIENPHLIYPGDRVELVYVDGVPQLRVNPGAGGRISGPSHHPTVSLSPKIRVEELDREIPTIPYDAIAPFLSRPRVVGDHELENAGYVLSSLDGHLISGTGTLIYARGADYALGQDFVVIRKGRAFRSSGDDDEILGYEAIHVADARVTATGDPASLMLVSSNREVLNGDRLLPVSEKAIPQKFEPTVPEIPVEAEIISVLDAVSQFGQYKVVVLNRGLDDGLKQGDVLGIYRSGIVVRDHLARENYVTEGVPPLTLMANNLVRVFKSDFHVEEVELPESKSGVLMVFRPFDRVSYALVMQTFRPVHLYDSVHNL